MSRFVFFKLLIFSLNNNEYNTQHRKLIALTDNGYKGEREIHLHIYSARLISSPTGTVFFHQNKLLKGKLFRQTITFFFCMTLTYIKLRISHSESLKKIGSRRDTHSNINKN
jgi:hypothetical protein